MVIGKVINSILQWSRYIQRNLKYIGTVNKQWLQNSSRVHTGKWIRQKPARKTNKN